MQDPGGQEQETKVPAQGVSQEQCGSCRHLQTRSPWKLTPCCPGSGHYLSSEGKAGAQASLSALYRKFEGVNYGAGF